MAALQPDGAIIVDESLTSGNSYWQASSGCPPFAHLTITGAHWWLLGLLHELKLVMVVGCMRPSLVNIGSTLYVGGAIGCGPPLSVGAAIACPDRAVINLQADGSAMYSIQALWTQARERLHVVTIICANRTYAILKVELTKQKIVPSNGQACRALTDIGDPVINWVALAQVRRIAVLNCS